MKPAGRVAILGVPALVLLVACGTGSADVAVIDGIVISHEAYDEYAGVFTSPEGDLRISKEMVLLSLLNQAIVRREADRLGIVIGYDDVSGLIGEMEEGAGGLGPLPRADDPAFRERVRTFALFKLVKRTIIGSIEISRSMLEAEYERDDDLHAVGYEDARPVIEERLIQQESDRRWTAWLESQRACANIQILDPSFGIPSSTPMPGCL